MGFIEDAIIGIFIILAVVIGAFFLWALVGDIDSRINPRHIWRTDDDNVVIFYKTKPPHFRNQKDKKKLAFTCGFCKNYQSGKGCTKYRVEYSGVGSVTKTTCDDWQYSE